MQAADVIGSPADQHSFLREHRHARSNNRDHRRAANRRGRHHRRDLATLPGWRVVIVCFVTTVFSWSFGFYGHGAYLAELQSLKGRAR
jgi:hypothetical protein